MQISDPRLSNSKQDYSIAYGLPHDSDVSQASTCTDAYTDRSTFDWNRLGGSKKFRGAARGVVGAFITCFVPRLKKEGTGAPTIEANEAFSTSIDSKTSTISSISHSKFKYIHSLSTNDKRQEATKFSIQEISKATGNFSMENIIGQGGFGTVYRGKLKDGSLVAVKRTKKNLYGKHMSAEFMNEIQALSKVEHLNLVGFLGFLEHEDERIMVVEYIGNGTLREHLDGSRGDVLELAERLDIAIDVAHAITYLHMYTDHPIIHRDIKPSNILLTEKLRAKVTDFGFARLTTEESDATHISTDIRGTAGYLDPEYLRTYQLTEKSDVYSFGVLLVELVTGRRPIECNRDHKERITTRWAMQRFKTGDVVLAMDRRLRRSPAAIMAVEKVMGLALQCLAPSRRSRPSMKKCAEVLWGIRKDYREMHLSSSSPSRRPEGSRSSEVVYE